MRDFWDFLKTTALGGLFVILPAMLLYLVTDEMADLVVVLAKPITDLLFDVNLALLLPWAPTPFAGSVKIVPAERVRLLDVPLAEFTRALSQLGVGVDDLLRRDAAGMNQETKAR